MDRRSLAICAVFRNEAPYLLEWIAYHRAIGFDRFVLYDNGSTDGGADLIRNSPLAERVTVIHWPQRPGLLSAYRHFTDIFAPAYDWAAFIEPDEFILPLDGRLSDTLQRCAQASAVLVNWRVFGPAGHEEPPTGLVIENYDLRSEDLLPVNRHVKSIVRCADLLDVTQSPHEFRLKGPVCNPLGQEVPNAALQPTPCHQGLVINHYYTRSRREWLGKVHGGEAAFDAAAPQYTEDVFDHLASACRVRDDAIKAYVPQVRSLLAGAGSGAPPATEPIAPVAGGQAPPWSVLPAEDAGTRPPDAKPMTAPAQASPGGELDRRSGPVQSGPANPFAAGGSAPVAAPAASLAPAPSMAPVQPSPAANWRASGPDAQERPDGLALVFRDRSRPRAPWHAALRSRAAGLIDPDFLLDDSGRLREFSTDAEARAGCEAVLTQYQLG